MNWLLNILDGSLPPAERLGRVELVLRGNTWLPWLVFGAMALIALACIAYRARDDRPMPARRYVATACRALFLLLMLALLLRPALRLELEDRVRRALVLLIDDSGSMRIADVRSDPADRARAAAVVGDRSEPVARLDLVRAALGGDTLRLVDRLSARYDVRPFVFSESVRELAASSRPGAGATRATSQAMAHAPDASSWFDEMSGQGKLTAVGDALREVLARTRGQPLAGVLLVTDGAENAGNTTIPSAAELARQQGAPVYAWGVGVTSPKDVAVVNVFAQDMAFVDDEVPVSVRLRSGGLDGTTVKLSLRLGDQTVVSQAVKLGGGEQLVSLTFNPKRAGHHKLSAAIEPVADESEAENNVLAQPLRVIDAKIKVLMIEQAPRWEFKYLQAMLLRDRRVKLSCVLLEGDPSIATGSRRASADSPYLARFPATKEELFGYDLVIVGDVDPRSLTAGQLDAVHEFVSRLGGGLLMIAGREHAPWSYRGTPIEKLLPVEVEGARRSSGERSGDGSSADSRPIRLELTPAGRESPLMRLAEGVDTSAAIWAKLPPVFWTAAIVRARPAAEVLLVDPEPSRATRFGKMPVIAIQQYGVGQACFVGTDNTWRWRRNVGDAYYSALWGQIVQRLSLPHLLGESKRTQLSSDKRTYSAGERLTLFARAFDESFAPLTEPSLRASLSPVLDANVVAPVSSSQPAVSAVTLTAVPDQPGLFRGEFVAPAAQGAYRVTVDRDQKSSLELTVVEPRLELGDTAMNEAALRQLASATGGAFVREEDLKGIPETIRAKEEKRHTTIDIELWSSPAYFLLMLAVVTTEWILRKSMQLK